MRPLIIDFLPERPQSTHRRASPRNLMLLFASLLIAVEIGAYFHLAKRSALLERQLDRAQAAYTAGRTSTDKKIEAGSTFTPDLLTGVEQGFASTRRQHPAARLFLKTLSFDARQGKLLIHGATADNKAIDALRVEIQRNLPAAKIHFPSIKNNAAIARSLDFELALVISQEASAK